MHVGRLVILCTLLLVPAGATKPVAQERAPSPLRVYSADTAGLQMPVATHTANPPYTAEALKARVEGTMAIEVTIGTNGRVLDALVTQGLNPQLGMDEQAIAALSEWTFQPGTLNGQPVAVRTVISFTLRLR
jgi:TonB family protein